MRTYTQIIEYEKALLDNAYSLHQESKLLAGHNARSFYLAYLAFEELSKRQALNFLKMNFFQKENGKLEDDVVENFFKSKLINNHHKKLLVGFLPLPFFPYRKAKETISFLIKLREKSMYVDYLGGNITQPISQITEEHTNLMIEIVGNVFDTYIRQNKIESVEDATLDFLKLDYKNKRKWFLKNQEENNLFGFHDYVAKLFEIVENEEIYNQFKSLGGML